MDNRSFRHFIDRSPTRVNQQEQRVDLPRVITNIQGSFPSSDTHPNTECMTMRVYYRGFRVTSNITFVQLFYNTEIERIGCNEKVTLKYRYRGVLNYFSLLSHIYHFGNRVGVKNGGKVFVKLVLKCEV